MILRVSTIVLLLASLLALGGSGCATKKYARTRINERVAPLEQRTGELEETSRRNSQDIGRLDQGVQDVRGRAERAQTQADSALAKAEQANSRADSAEQSVNDLRNNLDRYSLQSTVTVNFNFDSYALTPEARTQLDQLAAQLKGRSDYILEIAGFADYVGSVAYNNQLTEKRAEAVRRYLAEQYAIPVFRTHDLGFGKSRPVADNGSRTGRAQNRRVEVHVLVRAISGGSSTAQTSTGSR
jgi:outer membrane protein OmpA-like peptidoglycan-associated protein